MAERALFLPERCDFTLLHCGLPMKCGRSRTTWEGKPGEGHEITENAYACTVCRAAVVVSVREVA